MWMILHNLALRMRSSEACFGAFSLNCQSFFSQFLVFETKYVISKIEKFKAVLRFSHLCS